MTYLSDILADAAQRSPRKVALRCKGRALTYAQVKGRVDRLAGVLRALHVRRGHHVSLVTANALACVELTFACAQIGAVCEQYNIRLSPAALVRLLGKSSSTVLVCSSAVWERLAPAIGGVGRPLAVILLDSGDAFGLSAYEELVAAAEPFDRHVERAASDPVLMIYTSGTSGDPHGVMLSHQALVARAEIDVRAMWFTGDDVVLSVLPLFHITSVSTFAAFFAGAEVVIDDSSRPEDIVRLVNEHGVTRMGVVPYVLRLLVARLEKTGERMDSLRYVLYGGEPIDEELLVRCRRVLGCGLIQGYGMTETASAVTLLEPCDHDSAALRSTVGRALPGMEVTVIDKQGRECQPGVLGEVAVKTPTLMNGYYRDAPSTVRVMREGWYFTGDIGFFDTAGCLTLVDRKNNLVITGGENVYPLEVERCIRGLGERIADVAVIGVPDPVWGEALAAFVVAAEGAPAVTADEIAARCEHCLGGYKKPRHVLFLKKIVRNASGKVVKDALRRALSESAEKSKTEDTEDKE
ncbi:MULTISPECIES: class I adenylate-forming enzyme family protein [unclassified Adlercreutzia]|uniref:class I adenylate-forming enzyme family protein n=1 Tax=unclassified Adlercreutzia TaxID=2636013 RepID=UPI0013ECCAFD|nr:MULTISPECIES: AMP-binding protein [unclassified Adlercreutzia]